MKYKTKKTIIKSILISILIIIIIMIITMPIVDYSRSKNNKLPVFAICVAAYKDGGSRTYLGLGYKVYAVIHENWGEEANQHLPYEERVDIVFTHPFTTFKEVEKRLRSKS